jgi:AGCS family alanine or glycine:cation symporter
MANESLGALDWLRAIFDRWVVAPLDSVIFFDLAFWDHPDQGMKLPLVVVWLMVAAVFFTLRFQFVNVRAFRHALDCVRGRYSRPGDLGEISHFQALSAALSATVGLGNIAGVAVAVGLGGPGAVFWMVMAGVLGMSSKFAECTLGQRYRIVRADGHVSGGPMHYLRAGLSELGLPRLGAALSVFFALMCIGGSLGGGNMFQANQSYQQLASVLWWLEGGVGKIVYGLALAFAVGLVILGGIRRIGEVAGILVPIMCTIYVLSGLTILAVNADALTGALATLVSEAFAPRAVGGGAVGVLIQGFRRAAFSNEAGIGSAPIAHSAAATQEPVREGVVALLEPFVDTVIVCTVTGLVLVVTGAYTDPNAKGIAMTSLAFASVFPWFPVVLALTAVLFAYSTMISWSYYGEQCWAHLFGLRSTALYKLVFLFFTWLGAVFPLATVVEFSDLVLLGMAFPTLVGVVLLSSKVKRDLDDYLARLRAGAFPVAGQPEETPAEPSATR